MALSNSQIDTIAKQVYRQFPEVKGTAPAIASMTAKTPGVAEKFVLTFKGKGVGPGGRSIPRIVRVVADLKGAVLKMSTSR
ncbi:MAG: hypothetical protein JNL73_05180 [Anaerolineales bacterium]|nr:hypothetical protein [Anaerolineales bacterium]